MARKDTARKQQRRRRQRYPGIVYLEHLATPLKGTQHYIGWAKSPRTLTQRHWHHHNGTGARYLRAANEAGIEYTIVRTWKGSRLLERVLKERKEAPHLCPVCAAARGLRPLPARYTEEQIRAAYARFQTRLVRRLLRALEEQHRAYLNELLEREGSEHAIKAAMPALRRGA